MFFLVEAKSIVSANITYADAVIGVPETPAVVYPPHSVSATAIVPFHDMASLSFVVPSAPSQPLPSCQAGHCINTDRLLWTSVAPVACPCSASMYFYLWRTRCSA